MSRKDYRSLTIPIGLYTALDQYMEQSKGSYVSIAEVVREALRAYLQAHKWRYHAFDASRSEHTEPSLLSLRNKGRTASDLKTNNYWQYNLAS